MTNQMPERIYLNDVDGDNIVDNFVWSSAKQMGMKAEYIRADLAQKTVTREEVMQIALESGIMLSTQYGQADGKLMPVSDTETLLRFAKSLISLAS